MASLRSAVPDGIDVGARGAREPRVDFLGLGVQKAGTTWLHRVLAAHPEIGMAAGDDKDLRFFNAYYDRGHRWYEGHFQHGGVRRRGEFSTSYFYSKDAPERVHRYNPRMRFLLSLRDPVRRVISQHRHEIRVGRLTLDFSLERALENNPSYVEQSMYFTQLSRWLEWFPLSSFHIVLFEELFLDPSAAVRELYAFVGVSPAFVPEMLREKVNEGRLPRHRLLDRGFSVLSAALRSLGAGNVVESLKKTGAYAYLKGSDRRSEDDMGIDDRLLEKLRAEFAAENNKLAAVLGRDLSIWTALGAQDVATGSLNARRRDPRGST